MTVMHNMLLCGLINGERSKTIKFDYCHAGLKNRVHTKLYCTAIGKRLLLNSYTILRILGTNMLQMKPLQCYP